MEDDAAVLRLLTKMLGFSGVLVSEACNGEQDPRTGVVDIPARLGQQAYTRFFEGDTRQGNICEDARKMTEFDGNQVKITYNTSIEVDGRLGTDAEWFLMDRTQPGKSTSGVERTFMEICE